MADELRPVKPPVKGETLEKALDAYATQDYPHAGSGDYLRDLRIDSQEPVDDAVRVSFTAEWYGANLDRDEREYRYVVLVRAVGSSYEVVAATLPR